jgi:anionic cell wall polymer biosynthesis LytR-Cps2A-Psr (LCP) family protein
MQMEKFPKKKTFLTGIFDLFRSIFALRYYFITVVGFILLLFFLLRFYKGFADTRFYDFNDTLAVNKWDGKERISILLIGGDVQSNGYIFVDHLCIFEVDPFSKEVRIFNISPYFINYSIPQEQLYSFKNSIAYYQSINEADVGLAIKNAVERLVGVRIDNYIYLEKNNIAEIFWFLDGMVVESPSFVDDSDLQVPFKINKGDQKLEAGNFIDFLSSDDDGWDSKTIRQMNFLKSALTHGGFVNLLINSEKYSKELASSLTTDLGFSSLVRLFFNLRRNRYDVKIGYTKRFASNVIYTQEGEFWIPVYEDIDQEVQKIFTRNSVKLEQAKLQVVNSTSTAYLAQTKARWFSNRGIRISMVDNTSQNYEINTIFVSDLDKYENTVEEIRLTLRNRVDIILEDYPERRVGDIVLVIGDNEVQE